MAKRWTTVMAGTLAAGLVAGGALVSSAHAGTTVCDKFGQTRTESGYVAQNDVWGADTPQCISVSGDGFTITSSGASKGAGGAPASYPSLFWGCHYGTCTTGFSPLRADSAAFAGVRTAVQYDYATSGSSVYDASYDIWFDPTPKRDGQNYGAEMMIWLKSQGGVQPVGSKVATVTLAGTTWDVWFGNIGWNVVSYVRATPSTTLSTPVADFYGDAVRRGYAQSSWYLTSVQAGFEPWRDGAGLALTSFSVSTDGAAPQPRPTTPAPSPSSPAPAPSTTTPAPTAPAPSAPAAAPVACRVRVSQDSWPGGFVRYVDITNTGSAPIRGWALTARVAPGQTLTNGWSAAWSQSGEQLSARNLDWNATIAPGATVTIGYQGAWSGAATTPAGWALGGTPCATAAGT